jgi:hypothetical protein
MSSLTTADLADTLHPNDAGYQKMADAFHRGIQAAGGAGWPRNPKPEVDHSDRRMTRPGLESVVRSPDSATLCRSASTLPFSLTGCQ